MLDSYLMNVRMADYLRSREDVKEIWMFGLRRLGASMLAATARSTGVGQAARLGRPGIADRRLFRFPRVELRN